MDKTTFRHIRVPLLGAVAMSLLGAYSIAYVDSFDKPDLLHLKVALIVLGPLIAFSGWLIGYLQPSSKLGSILFHYGFNFGCGFFLSFLSPLSPSFGDWLANGSMLCFIFLAMAANSWLFLYDLYENVRLAPYRFKPPRRQRGTDFPVYSTSQAKKEEQSK